MKRLITWIILTVLLVSCGQDAPPRSTPAPDLSTQDFHAADVTIDTGAVTLTGTLLTPLDDSRAPVVIIIPGSGAATRNGSWNMYRNMGE